MADSLLLVLNARAGRSGMIDPESLLPRLREAGWDPHIARTTSPAEAKEVVATHGAAGGGAVVSLGGDGTIHSVLQGLDFAQQTLGIIPVGSGNDIYRNFRAPHDLETALAPILRRTITQWDVGTVGDLRFLNSAGVGLDSETLMVRERSRGAIRRNYALLFLKTLSSLQLTDVEMEIDGEVMQDRGWWYIVANGPWIGGGMFICPGGSVTDGQLEILCMSEVPKWRLIQALPRVFKGTHLTLPGVKMLHGREVVLRTPARPQRIAVDGELADPTPVTIRLLPGVLRVFSPN